MQARQEGRPRNTYISSEQIVPTISSQNTSSADASVKAVSDAKQVKEYGGDETKLRQNLDANQRNQQASLVLNVVKPSQQNIQQRNKSHYSEEIQKQNSFTAGSDYVTFENANQSTSDLKVSQI